MAVCSSPGRGRGSMQQKHTPAMANQSLIAWSFTTAVHGLRFRLRMPECRWPWDCPGWRKRVLGQEARQRAQNKGLSFNHHPATLGGDGSNMIAPREGARYLSLPINWVPVFLGLRFFVIERYWHLEALNFIFQVLGHANTVSRSCWGVSISCWCESLDKSHYHRQTVVQLIGSDQQCHLL